MTRHGFSLNPLLQAFNSLGHGESSTLPMCSANSLLVIMVFFLGSSSSMSVPHLLAIDKLLPLFPFVAADGFDNVFKARPFLDCLEADKAAMSMGVANSIQCSDKHVFIKKSPRLKSLRSFVADPSFSGRPDRMISLNR